MIQKLPKVLYLLYALLRILFQVLQLCYVFLSESYDYILVQNPPCVPLLFVLALLKTLRLNRSTLIIDWHNYGYSIMRVNRVSKVLVFIGKVYEMFFGRFGDVHLCVSRAMQIDLVNKMRVNRNGSHAPYVLYDKATNKFSDVVSIEERHAVFQRAGLVGESINKTLFT